MSVDSAGNEASWFSYHASIDADGQIVAFDSAASNLVQGDTNFSSDVFVHDRSTGATTRVSIRSNGTEGNGQSIGPMLSADGQVVAFESYATNLVPGDTNGQPDVFVHDRATGKTTRVSVDSSGVQGDFDSHVGSLSADGQVVAFQSYATNLVPGDTNSMSDVFVHDRRTGVTTRVSVDSSGVEGDNFSGNLNSISADGQIIAFYSWSTNLVAGDTNGYPDVFVHDQGTGQTTRVSISTSGVQGDNDSFLPSMSPDGRFVAFEGWARNLVSNDTNFRSDVFLHDRKTGVTERVSVNSSGGEANDDSFSAEVSADGQFVAFHSLASNLVFPDSNNVTDIFIHNVATGETRVVSADCAGNTANGYSSYPVISADGQTVAFESDASNLVPGDTNGFRDVFVGRLVDLVDASWSNYGQGFPGTSGIPSISCSTDPAFDATFTIHADNSRSQWTVGVLLVGGSSASLPTSAGGTLLVDPASALMIVAGIPPSGFALQGTVPRDPVLCGVSIFLQALELDQGAQHQLSFTPGLELLFGY